MAVSRVKNEDVYLSFNESGNSFENIVSHADSSTAKKSALFISCGIWILNSLFNILDSDKSLENSRLASTIGSFSILCFISIS